MLKKIFQYIPSVILPLLINSIILYVYTDAMEPEEYGVLNIYLNSIMIVYTIVFTFLQSTAYRMYSTKLGEDKEVYCTTYIISNVLIGVMLSLVSIIINCFIIHWNILLIVVSAVINSLFQFYMALYRLENQVKGYSFFRIFSVAGNLVLILLIIKALSQLSYINAVVAMYGIYLLLVILETWKRRSYLSIKKYSFELLKESFKYGIPMTGVNLLLTAMMYADQYIILWLLDEKTVGYYSLGAKISDMIFVNLTNVIILVMTPFLMNLYDQDCKEKCQKVLMSEINLELWLVLPVAVALIVFTEPILQFFFPKYMQSLDIIRLLSVAGVFHGLSTLMCKPLELIKKPEKEFLFLLIITVIKILYSILGIQMYGVNATAHGTIISYIVYVMLLMIDSRKYLRINIDRVCMIKLIGIIFMVVMVENVINSIYPINSLLELCIHVTVCVCSYLLFSVMIRIFKHFTVKEI